MSKELYELPSNWIWTRVGEIAEVIRGASPRPKGDPRYFGGKIPWIMISDISREKGKYVSKTKDTVTEEGAKRSRHLKAGTLILSNSGTVCVPKILAVDGCIHDGFVAFPHLADGVEILYLYHWFDYVRPIVIQENWRGITQVNLNTNIVKNLVVPLPPANEQRRIVAKVEALFAESKSAREALDKVPLLLRRFRKSVLAKAFRGELTQRDPSDESAQKLLEKIKQGRKKGKQTALIENQKELTIDLPKLPETWIWTTTGEVFEVASGGTPKRDKSEYWNGDVPWVTSGEVAFSDITDTQAHITQEGLENSSAKLCPPGTVLLALYGEGKTRGQAAILRISATTNQAIACILCSKTSLPSEYVYWWFYYRYMETRRIGEGANQPNIYLHHVKAMPFPLAPISDQRRIVARIDELFSLANAIEAKVKEAREQAEKIDQTILAKAFKGELVPQDPNDEPASVLVQRINTTTKQPLKAKAIQQKIL